MSYAYTKKESGQTMLLVVLVLGGVMIGASAIAGLLTVYQVRQSSDTTDSTKAVFAADSGVECELYKYNFTDPTSPRSIDCANQSFDDIRTRVQTVVVPNSSGSPESVKSLGNYNRANRGFLIEFSGATTTLP